MDAYCKGGHGLPRAVAPLKKKNKRWLVHVACMGERRGVCRVLVGKSEGKRPLGKLRSRWEVNRMHLQEMGSGEHVLN